MIFTGAINIAIENEDWVRRALGEMPGGSIQFVDIMVIILSAILSAIIEFYVTRCLNHVNPKKLANPNWWDRFQLRRCVRSECRRAGRMAEALKAKLDGAMIDLCYGDDLHAALLRMAANLTLDDLRRKGAVI